MDQDQTCSDELSAVAAAKLVAKLGAEGAREFVDRFEVYMWDHAIPSHFRSAAGPVPMSEGMLACLDAQAFVNDVKGLVALFMKSEAASQGAKQPVEACDDCATCLPLGATEPVRICRPKPGQRDNCITANADETGVTVHFPPNMVGKAMVLVESGHSLFVNGWLVSKNSLGAIPQELVRQLAELRLPPAA